MRILTKVRVWLWVLIVGLLVSGITAFPLEPELRLASAVLHADWSPSESSRSRSSPAASVAFPWDGS